MSPPRALGALALMGALALACRPGPGQPPDDRVWGPTRGKGPRIVMDRAKADKGDPAALLDMLEAELQRNFAALSSPDLDPPAYYMGYTVTAVDELYLEAEDGALLREDRDRNRVLDIDVRVGDRQRDNSHSQGGDHGPGNGLGSGMPITLDDVELSLSQAIWLDTETQYKAAVSKLRDVESSEQLRSEDDGPVHPDFSKEKPTVHVEPEQSLDLAATQEAWRDVLAEISAELGDDPLVLRSSVSLSAEANNQFMVNTEGSRVQTGRVRLRIMLEARAQAADGMYLQRSESFEAHTPEQLPDVERLRATATRLREELLALRKAPIADPYTGPAILEGRAAGVFFHEIFGHRLEGHRQKDDLEGQTFTDKLDRRVLPGFLDVVDDPTVTTLGGIPLSGHYFVDDEGVPAQRTLLVDRGRLKTFLLGRSPVLPFRRSNGHGRRAPGYQTVARQGNLVVTSRKTYSSRELRQELIEEIKRQDRPYGLRFSDIDGGYTITDRSGPQAFRVTPLMVYRVYADGRPDELVRGVEIVGTPLASFDTIVATGDEPGIFNGVCGAESGWVPVSAVSPSLLLESIEIERAAHDRDRPPLLPAPGFGAPGSGGASHTAGKSTGKAPAQTPGKKKSGGEG
ncbi:TldD/PmbA family protein [Paraliomyxa miuraensis]|uniref:TldD/PmbA family protein n=1 Tax=Paraliomyxa miuraensis TaxID=376150 RepID=UPI00225AB004|nr:metallopeptidase TldD-related protein [Paraliomyxa miuraensis]MCX4247598.1 metallopeptidase TldD-related protein [Paraliomyxa miuraensis]